MAPRARRRWGTRAPHHHVCHASIRRRKAPSGDGAANSMDVTVLHTGVARNVLAMGTDETLVRSLDSLLPHLRQPLYRWTPGQGLRLPPPGVLGTVIIENAGALSPSDQRRLFDWLTVTRGDIRIVSTTAVALLPLVESGSFIASLYYRLNIVCIGVAAPSCDRDIACALNITVRSL